MHSHHSHSGKFCSHGHPGSTPQSMLDQAERLGFHTYGLSEHVPRQKDCELYPEEVEEGSTPEKLMQKWRDYLVEARRQQKSRENVRVLVGAETENLCPATLQWLKEDVFDTPQQVPTGALVGRGVVDYLVGSVHHAGGHRNVCCSSLSSASTSQSPDPRAIPIDFDQPTFKQAVQHFGGGSGAGDDTEAQMRLALAYLEAQYQLIDALRPEIIGHFDLCRLFEPSLSLVDAKGDSALASSVASAVRRNIRLAASYGALFEINSASLRKGWATPYPGKDVLKQILAQGGRVCLSDDAHGVSHVAISYEKSREYLVEMGLKTLWHLELDQDGESGSVSEPEQEEKERQEREVNSAKPGNEAPVKFARGTKAVSDSSWQANVFWKHLDAARKEASAQQVG